MWYSIDVSKNNIIAVTRRILAAVESIGKSLKSNAKAVGESHEATNEKKAEQQEIRATVNLPEGIETRQSKADATSESTYRKRTLIVSVVGLFLVLAYTTVAAFQWCEMRQATNLTREALTSVQRAFVFYTPDVQPSWITDKVGSTKIVAWTYFIPRKNTGTTGTRNLREYVSASYGTDAITESFDFHDSGDGVSGSANPQVTNFFQTGQIPTASVQAAQNGKQHIYVFGWIRYNDVFEGTPERITKFCFEVHPLSGDYTNTKGGPFGTKANFCTVGSKTIHNCSDEDCGRQNPN